MSCIKCCHFSPASAAFDLGLERTGGFKTVAFCEIDPFCQKVLAKHWPGVPCYDDVRTLTAERLAADGITIDVICGGFPCQDISVAGAGAGLAGERSGLWSEIVRLACCLRPRFLIVENVAALLGRGLGEVLGDLAAIGYDAEWHCIPASALGAAHRRDRIWILAYADTSGRHLSSAVEQEAADFHAPLRARLVADSMRLDEQGIVAGYIDAEGWARPLGGPARPCRDGLGWWETEPDVGRVADGAPSRVDRLKALGNAVVPQIPELIGRAILEAEAR